MRRGNVRPPPLVNTFSVLVESRQSQASLL